MQKNLQTLIKHIKCCTGIAFFSVLVTILKELTFEPIRKQNIIWFTHMVAAALVTTWMLKKHTQKKEETVATLLTLAMFCVVGKAIQCSKCVKHHCLFMVEHVLLTKIYTHKQIMNIINFPHKRKSCHHPKLSAIRAYSHTRHINNSDLWILLTLLQWKYLTWYSPTVVHKQYSWQNMCCPW